MAELEFKTHEQKIAYIMSIVPQARNNYVLLILMYWQIFDDIEISEETIKQIVERATQPETITRSRRKVTEQLKYKQFLELQRMRQAEVKEEAP